MNLTVASSVGTQLRAARENQGMSLDELARRTRIPKPSLEALECDDWGRLPGTAYIKGFVRAYAAEVELDADPLLTLLASESARLPKKRRKSASGLSLSSRPVRSGRIRGATGWAVGAAVTLVLVLWLTQEKMDVGHPAGHKVVEALDSEKE